MKLKKAIPLLLIFWGFGFLGFSQGLLDDLEEDEEKKSFPTLATFETTRIINSQSVENPNNGVLLFIISHRFGRLNDGPYELFGLDQANIRFGLEYGITNRLAVGLGRSSNPKTIDGFIKGKILQQTSGGERNMPLSLSIFADGAVDQRRWTDPAAPYSRFSSRLAYSFQILMARKFTRRLSIQFSPTLVHKNLVPRKEDSNDIYLAGLGGRYKVGAHWAINAEYFFKGLPWQTVPQVAGITARNPFSVGVDLETGGHVFQFHVTNCLGAVNRVFMTETLDQWGLGQLHLGFNITRVFNVKEPREKK